MKNVLTSALCAGLALLAVITGCSDPPTGTPPPVDTNYVRFKTSDKFTFHYYARDINNQRVDASKQVRVWTVVNTSAPIGDRTGVAMIEEVSYDATGTTPTGARDTFYIQCPKEGEVWQFDLLRSVLKQIDPQNQFNYLKDLPGAWIHVSHTKLDKDTTWISIEGGKLVNTVAIASIPTTITIEMRGQHTGIESVSVPAGTYSGFHTTQQMLLSTESSVASSKDTFNISYDFSTRDGLLRQVMHSNPGFYMGLIPIAGFEMELVKVEHAN